MRYGGQRMPHPRPFRIVAPFHPGDFQTPNLCRISSRNKQRPLRAIRKHPPKPLWELTREQTGLPPNLLIVLRSSPREKNSPSTKCAAPSQLSRRQGAPRQFLPKKVQEQAHQKRQLLPSRELILALRSRQAAMLRLRRARTRLALESPAIRNRRLPLGRAHNLSGLRNQSGKWTMGFTRPSQCRSQRAHCHTRRENRFGHDS